MIKRRFGVLERFAALFGRFSQRPRTAAHLRAASLRLSWREIFSDPPLDLTRLLGCKERTLSVGVEDGLLMQELGFYRQEILARANAFLGQEFFDKVRLDLLNGRASLAETTKIPDPAARPALDLPENIGGLDLPQDTPVGRCYAKYAGIAAGEKARRLNPEKKDTDHE